LGCVGQFARSADFAVNKEVGKPCANLGEDFRRGIHARLPEKAQHSG